MIRQIQYHKHGDPSEVLSLATVPFALPAEMAPSSVLVRWVASPVNPVDLYIIEGTYPIEPPQMPAIGGCEGVGVVEEIGGDVEKVKIGDRVIRQPIFSGPDVGRGVWTELALMDQASLLPIHTGIDLVLAATLGINFPTAFAMLRHIVPLKKGDFLVQNASNCGVGRAVIQLANYFGYHTINLVRKRKEIDALKDELKALGADLVFSEEEFEKADAKSVAKPRLALDCVGGRSALLLSSTLSKGDTIISYDNCRIKVPKLLRESIRNSFPLEKGSKIRRTEKNGRIKAQPHKINSLENYRKAVKNAIGCGVKQILMISPGPISISVISLI
ncbi:hypothetical protein niasHT_005468 [Heterodera trifolii]|uniref:Enoyl-[acyl-carrier-protein] reductase, mitochondrial n=1 Tax=Heterodera trifolii TaxID=157864 RepID=A0ABD2M5L5_9BILA